MWAQYFSLMVKVPNSSIQVLRNFVVSHAVESLVISAVNCYEEIYPLEGLQGQTETKSTEART